MAAPAGHKVNMPYFAGCDPSAGDALTFLEQLESFRVMAGYTDANKINVLNHALVDQAKIWFDNAAAEEFPNIKTDWAVFEREFKLQYSTTLTVSGTISARANVKQAKHESVSLFYERCRHIVRLTGIPFVSPRTAEYQADEHYIGCKADYKSHINSCDVLQLFFQGLLPEIRRLILHQNYRTAKDAKQLALDAERGLRNEGILPDPNAISIAGHTDVKSGTIVYGASKMAARQTNAIAMSNENNMVDPQAVFDNSAAVHAVASRGGLRGRGAGRGRGSGRGGGRGNRPQCKHCKQMGHEEKTCWAKYPHLKPSAASKSAAANAINGYEQQMALINSPNLYPLPMPGLAPLPMPGMPAQYNQSDFQA